MKKIVFVQKQQSSTYDPVSTFFAKNTTTKPSSVAKPPISSQSIKNNPPVKHTGSVERPPSTKAPIENRKVEDKQKPVTSKIGRKGEYMPPPPKRSQPIKKQQSIYTMGGGSKKNVNSRNTPNEIQQPIERQAVNQYNQQKEQFALPHVNQRRSPIKNINNQQNSNNRMNSQKEAPSQQYYPKAKQSSSQIQNLTKRIKQLQQKQDLQIQQFQQRYQKLEQKYNKLQKQHKLCGTETKQTARKLKQREEQIKKLLSKEQIGYNKKRQMLLQNQISNLKKINRELVMRIKNYKSTDLVQVSIMNNKTDILFKQYDHAPQDEDDENNANTLNNIDLSKIESLTYRTVQQIQKYLQTKNSAKEISWVEQKKILLELSNFCKGLSLQCMGFQFKMPSSNKQCINFYNEIEKYRHSLQPIISKYDLNFVITEQNIDLINKMNEDICYQEQFKEALVKKWTEEPKKFKKSSQASSYYLNKFKTQAKVYQKNTNVTNIIVAHCLSHISYIQSWVNKMSSNLKESLTNLNITLKEIEELNSLGDSGKETLLVYIKSNISSLVLKMPDLEFQVKEIGSIFRKVKFGNTKSKGK